MHVLSGWSTSLEEDYAKDHDGLVFLPLCFITKPDIQIWKDIKYAYTVSSDCPVAWPMFEKIDYSLTHEYN